MVQSSSSRCLAAPSPWAAAVLTVGPETSLDVGSGGAAPLKCIVFSFLIMMLLLGTPKAKAGPSMTPDLFLQ